MGKKKPLEIFEANDQSKFIRFDFSSIHIIEGENPTIHFGDIVAVTLTTLHEHSTTFERIKKRVQNNPIHRSQEESRVVFGFELRRKGLTKLDFAVIITRYLQSTEPNHPLVKLLEELNSSAR